MVMTVVSVLSLAFTLGIIGLKVATGVSAWNVLKETLDIHEISNFKNFDAPINDMVTQCVLLLARFMDFAQIIVAACAFLCIIFNAFKLWAGTVEIKKTYVDMVLKCVIVTALTCLWPSIISTTYKMATEIGVEAAGGADLLNYTFASVAQHTTNIIQEATGDYIAALKEGAGTENGKIIISQKALDSFSKMGFTGDEAKNWLSRNGIEVSDKAQPHGFWIWANDQKKAEKRAKKIIDGLGKANSLTYDTGRTDHNGAPIMETIAGKTKEQYIKQNIVILRALSEVLSGVPQNDMGTADVSQIIAMSKESLDSVFFNPYVDSKKSRLSISTMIKTSIILSKAFAEGALSAYDDFSQYSEEETKATVEQHMKHADLPMVAKMIGAIAEFFLYKIGMVISTLLLMIEYSICLIEFLLVAAVSSLLIPLYFIDATKQFVTNFIKMIFSYFIKLLVTTMMCFFVMGMYLRMAESMYTRLLSDANTIIYYVFILFIGLMLTKGSGKIASAVISGNPSMGLGDLVHEFRGIAGVMRSMEHLAHEAERDLQKVGNKTKGAARTGAEYAGAETGIASGMEATRRNTTDRLNDLQKTAAAKQANGETLDKDEEAALAMSQAEINAAGNEAARDYSKNAHRDFNKNQIFKALTGMDRRADSSSPLRLGQEFFDKDLKKWRTATWDDVEKVGEHNDVKTIGSNVSSDSVINKALKNLREKDIDEPEVGL